MNNNQTGFLRALRISAGLTAALLVVAACGGGGGSGNPATATPAPTTQTTPTSPATPTRADTSTNSENSSAGTTLAVSGGGIKGPMALARVEIFLVDTGAPDLRGTSVAASRTNAAAQIEDLQLPEPLAEAYLIEFAADEQTYDLTTGIAPSIPVLRTIVSGEYLAGGASVYSTPLSTITVSIAARRIAAGSNTTVLAAMQHAAEIVRDRISFGLGGEFDLLQLPPLLNGSTNTGTVQLQVARHRVVVEAISALIFELEHRTSMSSKDAMELLAADLSDGMLDASDGINAVSPLLRADYVEILTKRPAELSIPNTLRPISDVVGLLVEETALTGALVDVTALLSGEISVEPEPLSVDEERLPPVADQDPVPPIEDSDPVPPVADEEPAPPVEDSDPVPPVADEDPAPPVEDSDPVPPVADEDPAPPVEDSDPAPPVADEDPAPPVEDSDPVPPVADEDPAPPVEDTDPVPPVADEDPVAPVAGAYHYLEYRLMLHDTDQSSFGGAILGKSVIAPTQLDQSTLPEFPTTANVTGDSERCLAIGDFYETCQSSSHSGAQSSGTGRAESNGDIELDSPATGGSLPAPERIRLNASDQSDLLVGPYAAAAARTASDAAEDGQIDAVKLGDARATGLALMTLETDDTAPDGGVIHGSYGIASLEMLLGDVDGNSTRETAFKGALSIQSFAADGQRTVEQIMLSEFARQSDGSVIGSAPGENSFAATYALQSDGTLSFDGTSIASGFVTRDGDALALIGQVTDTDAQYSVFVRPAGIAAGIRLPTQTPDLTGSEYRLFAITAGFVAGAPRLSVVEAGSLTFGSGQTLDMRIDSTTVYELANASGQVDEILNGVIVPELTGQPWSWTTEGVLKVDPVVHSEGFLINMSGFADAAAPLVLLLERGEPSTAPTRVEFQLGLLIGIPGNADE